MMPRDDKILLYKIMLNDIALDLINCMDTYCKCEQDKIQKCLFSIGYIEDLYARELSGYLKKYIAAKEDIE